MLLSAASKYRVSAQRSKGQEKLSFVPLCWMLQWIQKYTNSLQSLAFAELGAEGGPRQ